MRIFQLLFILILFVHWIGCIWYILINNDAKDWIPPFDLNANETKFFDSEMTLFEQYGVCVYYSILLIIGTDIAPINTVQTIYSAIVVVFGALFCAFIFGNMASLLSAMNKKEQIF